MLEMKWSQGLLAAIPLQEKTADKKPFLTQSAAALLGSRWRRLTQVADRNGSDVTLTVSAFTNEGVPLAPRLKKHIAFNQTKHSKPVLY